MGNFLAPVTSFTPEEIAVLERMWEYKVLCGGGFRNAMICSVCKNKNTDACDCAKQRFFMQETPVELTEEQVAELERKKKLIREEKEYFMIQSATIIPKDP